LISKLSYEWCRIQKSKAAKAVNLLAADPNLAVLAGNYFTTGRQEMPAMNEPIFEILTDRTAPFCPLYVVSKLKCPVLLASEVSGFGFSVPHLIIQ
jgi:hypothetical protein